MRSLGYVPCIVLLILLLETVGGCALGIDDSAWHDRLPLVTAYFEKPLGQQIDTFPTYSLDDQLAIYLYGNQVLDPPAIYLAQPFGAEGGRIVAPLSKRLEQAENDATIRDLILVFSEMSRQHSYNVGQDSRLMTLLRESASRIKDPDWKRVSENEVSSIEP